VSKILSHERAQFDKQRSYSPDFRPDQQESTSPYPRLPQAKPEVSIRPISLERNTRVQKDEAQTRNGNHRTFQYHE